MTLAIRTVLALAALCYLGFGIAFLIAPLATLAAAGIELHGTLAAIEIRAFYGGVEIALGALIGACLFQPRRWRDGLLLSAASYGAIGITRVAGILLQGSDSRFLWFAGATELGFLLASAWLWRHAPKA